MYAGHGRLRGWEGAAAQQAPVLLVVPAVRCILIGRGCALSCFKLARKSIASKGSGFGHSIPRSRHVSPTPCVICSPASHKALTSTAFKSGAKYKNVKGSELTYSTA